MKTPKIIAEIGINHNGDIDLALDMITAASDAGAWAVKFQKREVKTVYGDIWDDPRNDGNTYGWRTQGEQKTGLELDWSDYGRIDAHCNTIGIPWFASAWDEESLEGLEIYDLEYNKISSAMLTHIDFVEAVAAQGKKTFISIGGAFDDEIDFAVRTFMLAKCPFVILHCVPLYPLPLYRCNIARVKYLVEMSMAWGCQVGYSGHEVGIIPSVAAMVLGAEYVERHITMDRSMYGSDQSASLEIPGLIRLVEYANIIPDLMGSATAPPRPDEIEMLNKMRYWKD